MEVKLTGYLTISFLYKQKPGEFPIFRTCTNFEFSPTFRENRNFLKGSTFKMTFFSATLCNEISLQFLHM